MDLDPLALLSDAGYAIAGGWFGLIHEPWKMDAGQQQKAQVKIGDTYPAPLTEHASAVKLARAKMAEVFRREGFRQTSKVVYEKLGSRRGSQEVRPPLQS